MEGEAYLRDGKVHRERQIRILAHYLDGKAHNFYMQKVDPDDPKNWNLHKFFTELFNYCFPVDYRQQMRIKLESFHQKHGQSVSEYVFELQELFSMVGTMPPEMKVIKLWYSLSARIQKALWRDNLHPDSSTWDEVVSKAEIIEIADSVVDRRDSRPQARRDWRSNNQNKSDNPHRQNYESASRSMTYTGRNRSKARPQSGNQNGRGSRQPSQSRPNSVQPSDKRPQNGSSASKPKTAWNSGSAKPKSVKFTGLSDKDMAQMRAEGRCFLCREVGHLSRNCPHKNVMPGNGNNRPPGVPSFSMDMTLIEDDNDTGDVLSSMPVGSMNITDIETPEITQDESWRKWYPIWQHPLASAREEIGNCYEMTAEYLLTTFQPYPGDESGPNWSPTNRFTVKQVGDTQDF
jgi:hypothetical protein